MSKVINFTCSIGGRTWVTFQTKMIGCHPLISESVVFNWPKAISHTWSGWEEFVPLFAFLHTQALIKGNSNNDNACHDQIIRPVPLALLSFTEFFLYFFISFSTLTHDGFSPFTTEPFKPGSQNLVQAYIWMIPRLTLKVKVIGQRSGSPGEKYTLRGFCVEISHSDP